MAYFERVVSNHKYYKRDQCLSRSHISLIFLLSDSTGCPPCTTGLLLPYWTLDGGEPNQRLSVLNHKDTVVEGGGRGS